MVPVCPGVVPVEALIGRNEWAGVVVQGGQAWADGFRLVVRAYCRDEPDTERLAAAQGRPGPAEVVRPPATVRHHAAEEGRGPLRRGAGPHG